MPNNIDQMITDLTNTVNRQKTVLDGATAYIEGVPALIQAAIDTAVAAGATPEQLSAFTALLASVEAEVSELEVALTNNTPTPPPVQ